MERRIYEYLLTEREAACYAAAPEMLAMLEELEWGWSFEYAQDKWCSGCRVCCGVNPAQDYLQGVVEFGHAPDCELAVLLRKARGE